MSKTGTTNEKQRGIDEKQDLFRIRASRKWERYWKGFFYFLSIKPGEVEELLHFVWVV